MHTESASGRYTSCSMFSQAALPEQIVEACIWIYVTRELGCLIKNNMSACPRVCFSLLQAYKLPLVGIYVER